MYNHNQLDQKLLNKIAFLDNNQREKLIPPEVLISQMPIQKIILYSMSVLFQVFLPFLWQKAYLLMPINISKNICTFFKSIKNIIIVHFRIIIYIWYFTLISSPHLALLPQTIIYLITGLKTTIK